MRSLGWLVLLLITACAVDGGVIDTTTTTTPPAATATSPTTSTIAPPGTSEVEAGCPEDSGFVDAGRVLRLDQPTSDTTTIGLISWQAVEGCERFTIRFETTEGAPATTPPTIVLDFIETRQVLRIWTAADSTVVTDHLVETPLVDRMFVVRALAGGMFIDLHLKDPAQARAETTNSPASLTLEMQGGIQPFDSSAVYAGNTVLTDPQDGGKAAAGVPLEVKGYSRVFEATMHIVATVDGEMVAETSTTAAEWTETWGEFTSSIQLPPGDVSLFVGEQSPDDGEPTGVTIDVTVR
ncbi:MAG TPA: Gmad2 immunoglobulin-like domain-containing protein [Acidimicrobiia bacterium]|nr:Gmad2 immunoglobulin-like domain-containing protein [Acidimicrobiia bacterium]